MMRRSTLMIIGVCLALGLGVALGFKLDSDDTIVRSATSKPTPAATVTITTQPTPTATASPPKRGEAKKLFDAGIAAGEAQRLADHGYWLKHTYHAPDGAMEVRIDHKDGSELTLLRGMLSNMLYVKGTEKWAAKCKTANGATYRTFEVLRAKTNKAAEDKFADRSCEYHFFNAPSWEALEQNGYTYAGDGVVEGYSFTFMEVNHIIVSVSNAADGFTVTCRPEPPLPLELDSLEALRERVEKASEAYGTDRTCTYTYHLR